MVHNSYASSTPSGENEAFKNEAALLVSQGHEVETFLRDSDEIRSRGVRGLVQGALATPWNPWMAHKIRQRVTEFKPDVVHVHNTFPLLSPAIFTAVGELAPRVLTLHNYRLFCPAATLLRPDGTSCTDCLDQRSVLPSLYFGCYRKSRIATTPLAISVALHRRLGTWTRQVDAFVLTTEFQRKLMVSCGLPAKHAFVKPNFFPGNPRPIDWDQRNEAVIFAGRLSIEKGADHLVSAWVNWGASAPQLIMVGDGPLRQQLQKQAARSNVVFKGQQTAQATQAEIAKAKLLVLPSQAFEGLPMVVCEAFAHGTPVAVADSGPLSTIVEDGINGILFAPNSPLSLESEIRSLWCDTQRLHTLANGARKSFEAQYTEQANHDLLIAIYKRAGAMHQQRTSH